ncbi:MAG: tetratricopeptide repeat protein [Candidatus Omnitrophota bacterium]|nr:tetratricopeptide repeat protein [Candidatus Omnitrophota bacterium]MDZ4241336.1 tetratricopeptide repeat protein [Candidatus Omnitrophota bacterium]
MKIKGQLGWLTLLCLILAFSSLSCAKLKRDHFLSTASKAHDSGNYEKAIKNYKKALEIRPDDITVHCNLGVAHLELGQMAKVRVEIAKIAELGDQETADYLKNLIRKKAKLE